MVLSAHARPAFHPADERIDRREPPVRRPSGRAGDGSG